MRNAIYALCTTVICSLGLVGCSGTYHAYRDTLSYAFKPPADIELSAEQITASAADLLYFRYGEQRQVVLALAFMEHSQQKWISADNAVVVLQHGRIVRTAGLPHNLLFVTASTEDPLTRGVTSIAGSRWQSLTDWQQDEYGYLVQSQFSQPQPETLVILEHSFNVLKVTETLSYKTRPQFWRFDQQWQNEYWFEQSSGQLLKSRQQYAPFQPLSEMVFISRAARLAKAG